MHVTTELTVYLPEWLDLGVHDEVELAELAAPGVGALDPLLQARLVHVAQGTRAEARRDERVVGFLPFTVADTTHVTTLHALTKH